MSTEGELTSPSIDVPDEPDAAYEALYERGETDGLPVIPPTEERVRRMIDYVGLPPDQVVGMVPLMYGEATVEAIAVNAVMAGCRPEYMPVLIAAVETLADDGFNLTGFGTSTSTHGIALIVNGPIRGKLDLNSGGSCLGPGWRANATIGRAINLIATNVGGLKPVEVDKTTYGFPGRYSFCFAENEEGSLWEPLHVERGFKAGDSTVTVFAAGSIVFSYSPIPELEEWLRIHASGMATMGSHRFRSPRGESVMVVTSGLARVTSKAGMTKQDVREFLHEHGAIAESQFPDSHQRERLGDVIKDGKIYPHARPEDLLLVVAGRGSVTETPFETVFVDGSAGSRSVTSLIHEPG